MIKDMGMESSSINTENYNGSKNIVEVLEKIILRRHDYYAKQDKKYKKTVSGMRLAIAILSLINTIVLGIRISIPIDIQLSIGLVISAISTFIAGLLAYYNYEKYWMRNITKHIRMNILRDSFMCDKADNKLDDERISYYRKQLEEIEKDNITYWKKVSNQSSEKEVV